MYIPANISHSHVTSFFNPLIISTSCLLSDNLHIICGDLNDASTRSLTLLVLQSIVTFNTQLTSKLDHLFDDRKDIFKAYEHAPHYYSDTNTICALLVSTLTPTAADSFGLHSAPPTHVMLHLRICQTSLLCLSKQICHSYMALLSMNQVLL